MRGGKLYGSQLIIVDKEKSVIAQKSGVLVKEINRENPLIPVSFLGKDGLYG